MLSKSKIILILCVISGCNIVQCEHSKDSEDDQIFVPTHEWQVVKKGQKIPKGLHVRVNFETGVTEAKILDEEEREVPNKNTQVLEIPHDEEDSKLIDTDSLKDALKKIEGDDIVKPDEIKRIKDQFRSYDKLKEEMGHLNLTPKIDAEVLQDLFKQHKEEIEKENMDAFTIARILEDFDFLAHQIDNGVEFVRQNGFHGVIYKNLNITNDQIKEETLKLLGSLLQNNPKVQIHALETGTIGILLKILTLEESAQVKSRAVYAMSCLLRRFPLAQLRFIENGGLSVISKLFEKDSVKIQLKLVTLMNDLILENVHAKDFKQAKAESQYNLVNLESLLLEQNWCDNLNRLLLALVAIDPEDHDALEKCLISMSTVAKDCAKYFHIDVLVNLQARYKALIEKELDGRDEESYLNYYKEMLDMLNNILSIKNVKTEL